jgi:branched-chain amino acid transport system ATP-binding protein
MTVGIGVEPGGKRPPLLKAKGLVRRFGGLTAVSDFSFELYEGEILGMIGPNGAGKSTTFNLISGFYRPTAGRLWFRGEDITKKSAMHISRMGLVRTFQHDSLLRDMTVYDNILIGTVHSVASAQERDRRVRETAELVGLKDSLGEVACSLPHGRQRLLSVAIALAARPVLLCLDEPLTGLQSAEVSAALDLFQMIRDEYGAAILLVEHNMRAVMRICQRIVVLHYGELLAEGTPDQVSRDPAVIEAYLGAQR